MKNLIICLLLTVGSAMLYAQKTETCTDIDGNAYRTVTIGTQVWMAEDLKSTKYNDGTPIPLVEDSAAWGNLSAPGYCWYNNDEATHKPKYGALYNWYVVGTGKLAPAGWHVPTDQDWKTLELSLGMTQAQTESVSTEVSGRRRGKSEGGMLKVPGTEHWYSPNSKADNSTGFSALPGGDRFSDGMFNSIGYGANWWTSTELDAAEAWARGVYCDTATLDRAYNSKKLGFSVRCVKD